MGGIFGVIGVEKARSSELLRKMADTMAHRGDNAEFISEPFFSAGMVRHPWETDTKIVGATHRGIIAVCEGEIYNATELARALGVDAAEENNPMGFDVVVPLYERYGKDFARNINGVFTIALYDLRQNTLLLARDHLGSHSVFYSRVGNGLVFGSTISALFATGQVSNNIDKTSLDRYLASLAISPPHTIFKNIKAARPGHLVVIREGYTEEYEYWALGKVREDYTSSEDQFGEALRHTFEDAVKIRAEHGGDIGLLVSGGVDTSAVAAVLSKTTPAVGLKGFSVAFNEKEFSDAHLQDIIYSRFKIEPNRILLKPGAFASTLEEAVQFLDSPVNDVAFAGMFYAFRTAASTGCTAVFEGEGSDEIFCTGHSFGELQIQPYLFLPYSLSRCILGPFKQFFSEQNDFFSKVIRLLARIGMSDLERRSTWIPGFPWKTRKKLLNAAYKSNQTWDVAADYYSRTKLNDMINIYQYGLTRLFLPDDLLFKNERMASAAGITNRTPFIDYRLVEKAFEIPAHYKIQQPSSNTGDGTKLIFKKAMRGLVPDQILDRKKTRGFSQPTALWFRSELKDFVSDHILSKNAKISDWLDTRTVHRIYRDFMNGHVANDYFLNSLLILELWMQHNL